MSLRESEIAVKAVQQNFERVLQRLKMVLLGAIGFRARFAHRTEGTRAKPFVIVEVSALQFLSGQRRDFLALAKPKMPRNIDNFKTGECPHADIVKLRQEKRIDEMAAIDRKLRVIDCFLRNLESRWTGAQKSAAAPPVKFCFRFPGARNQIR